MYILGFIIGLAIHSDDGLLSDLFVATLILLLWVPLSLIFSVIEVQIERQPG